MKGDGIPLTPASGLYYRVETYLPELAPRQLFLYTSSARVYRPARHRLHRPSSWAVVRVVIGAARAAPPSADNALGTPKRRPAGCGGRNWLEHSGSSRS